MQNAPKPIEFIDLIKQPTYNHIIDNLEQIRQMACAKIMSITTEQLYDSMLSQANKGLVKYGMLIDDNHNFDSDQYTLEEITDLIIYIANKEVRKIKNPVSEFEGILKGKTHLTVDEFNRISNQKRDDEWLQVRYELQKQAWKENDDRFAKGWLIVEKKMAEDRNKKNNSNHNV